MTPSDSVLLINTRPDDAGEGLQKKLLSLGQYAVWMPVMSYQSLVGAETKKNEEELEGWVVFTSVNGVNAFQELHYDKPIKNIFAVGKVTAESAKAIPHVNLWVASGDMESLLALLLMEYQRQGRGTRVIHVGGVHQAGGAGGSLVERLVANNIPAKKWALYDMVAMTKIMPEVLSTLQNPQYKKIILFFSPRTVELAKKLLLQYNFKIQDFSARCYSANVERVAKEMGFVIDDDREFFKKI